MAQAAIQIDGAREVKKALRQAGRMADLKNAHKEAAAVVVKDAVVLVPKRSGTLAKSIRAAGLASSAEVRAGNTRVSYAGPVHFGWPNRPNKAKKWRGGPIRPNPFLYKAVDRRRGDVVKVYERRVNEALAKAGLDG